jgi:hypothetical protein
VLAKAAAGLRLNEHIEHEDGEVVFRQGGENTKSGKGEESHEGLYQLVRRVQQAAC